MNDGLWPIFWSVVALLMLGNCVLQLPMTPGEPPMIDKLTGYKAEGGP